MNIVATLGLAVVGAGVSGQLNRAIYRWAWNPRSISPWSTKPAEVTPRGWLDCVPIFGWWRLRRETSTHGRGFWVRPMLIELCWMIGLPIFFGWSMSGGQLEVSSPMAGWLGSLQATFLANSVLLALMTIATFIDFDEKTIPDAITIPGTLFALLFATAVPSSLLPIGVPPAPILLNASSPWPPILDSPALLGLNVDLVIGLFCWIGWCLALLPYTVYFRRGVIPGVRFLFGSVLRRNRRALTGGIAFMCCLGVAGIVMVGWGGDATRWRALLSSLVGLAAAGSLVWSIRIVASSVMGVEAMGFGDVTLMAMIGAFLGWQASIICFFIAPFTSIGIAGAQWLITGNKQIAFGPFLCAGATIVIMRWSTIWASYGRLFEGQMALILVGTIACCIVLMGAMLAVLQFAKRLIGIDSV